MSALGEAGAKAGAFTTEAKQVAIETAKPIPLGSFPRPTQDCRISGGNGDRVEQLTFPAKRGELGLSARSRRFDELGILEVAEVRKGTGLTIFLPHEQKWESRREQEDPRSQSKRGRGEDRPISVGFQAVADLIMILGKCEEPLAGELGRGSSRCLRPRYGL